VDRSTGLAANGFLKIAGQRLEYTHAGPQPSAAPAIVLLHEGLGCAGLWGDFRETLSQATGCGVFAWSRGGYGKSSPVDLPRPITYMHEEAQQVLPALLDRIAAKQVILAGHSDGASIAAIYAGSFRDPRLAGISLMAPHFFLEELSITSIREAKVAYETTDLRSKLARWHENVDVAFYGWNDAWCNPDFHNWDLREYLPRISVPVQIIQGEDDQYGTVHQLEAAREQCNVEVETHLLPGIKHSPYRETPDVTCGLIARFAGRVLGDGRNGL